MSQEETWTVRRLLEWTSDFLKKKGSESPRLEAEILLADALGIKRIEIYTNFETEPDDEKRTKFRDYVKRRGVGEPVAYLVGYKEFFSLKFKVDNRVLIPRPETEQLVLSAIDVLKKYPPGSSPAVCDLCTGSGAIAVALAKNWPKTLGKCKIIASDISREALALAVENANSHGLASSIEFIESDLMDKVPGRFDLIVSNPPYVSESEYTALALDLKKYEPRSALLAGPRGTEVIQRIIAQAAGPCLNPGGTILIELSPMIAEESLAFFGPEWNPPQITKDHNGLKRIIATEKRE